MQVVGIEILGAFDEGLAERLENYRNEMKKAALESSDQLV